MQAWSNGPTELTKQPMKQALDSDYCRTLIVLIERESVMPLETQKPSMSKFNVC